jgi:hypothetical protein
MSARSGKGGAEERSSGPMEVEPIRSTRIY